MNPEEFMSNDYDDDPDDSRAERRRRERDDQPHGASNRPLFIILAITGGILLLCCGGLFGVGAYLIGSLSKELPQATSTADEFLDLLQEKKLDKAYRMTSADYRAKNTLEQFTDYVNKYEMFEKHTSRTTNGVNILQNGVKKEMFVKMTLQSPNNAMNCTLELIEESDGWKVEKFTVP